MIKYNNKTINDWYFDNKNIIKVYKNNAVCYYKIVSGGVTPSQEPCFAVVDDISSYQDREFVDVYDKATEKWYKLNNLNQYEQYGIYGEGRNITYYKGKLTIDEGYEYEWDGSQWVNLGEVSGGTAPLPDGYTEVEYVGSNGNAYINTGLQLMNTVGNTFSIEGRVWTEYYVTNDGFGYLMSTESTTSPYPGFCWRWNQHHSRVLELTDVDSNAILSTVDKGDGTSGFTVSSNGTSSTNNNIPFTLFAGLNGSSPWRFSKSKYYDELKITKNNQVVADYIPCQRDSDSKYGFYDLVTNSFKISSNSNSLIGGNSVSVYPKYYTEKDEPENNVVFTDMEEALAYECPYVGMFATIAGELYKFNANNEWEKLSFTITGVTRASEAFKIKLNNADADATILQDNGDGTYNFGVVYLDSITDTTSMASGNTNLVKFDFGNADISNLTTIGQNAFRDNSNLTTFEMPDGISTISSSAFYHCNNYIDVKIPESITRVGNYAFSRSSSSTYRRVYITDLSKWCDIYINGDGANPLNNGNLYLNNSLVTTLTLPSDITQVKDFTFYGCKSIQTLNIPDNITSIGTYAFTNNSNLSTINWGTGLTSIGQAAFYGTAIRSLIYPSGISLIPYQCFAYCRNLQTITIPDSVTTIDGYAFTDCNITSLTLSQNLTTIGQNAFAYNRNLTTLSIPSKVTRIGGYAFSFNERLRTLSLNQNLETIGDGCFSSCYSLQTVTIPDSVTTINNYAFRYCSGLTSITIEATTPPTLGTNVFDNTNDCPIYVPCASVNAYRTATNWSAYADRIVGFESCTTYDWQTISGEYVCDDGNKYEVEKYVRSFDNGTTWEDVTPLQTRKGTLIAEGVAECQVKTYTDGTYTYNALQDVTVPKKSISDSYNLYVPYDFEVNYKYSVEFTPLNFWTTSYYGFILGNGDISYSSRETEYFHVFKMDNGWGTQFFRFGVILHNYNLGTRSGQGLPGAWTVYENVRAKIETHLVNYAAGNGATITVENEGYATYTGTSTKTVTSSWSPTYGVKNICLFGVYPANHNSANMKFHNFAVKTSTDELVYNYVPVERQSDGKLGVYDTVHNIFYLANDNLELVAGDYVYGE